MTGVTMRNANDLRVIQIIQDEIIVSFTNERNELRAAAKNRIQKVHNENR